MTIAFQLTDFNKNSIYKDFNYHCVCAMANKYPEINFLLITNYPITPDQNLPMNCSLEIFKPIAKSSIFEKIFFRKKRNEFLKKINPAYFFINFSEFDDKFLSNKIVFCDDIKAIKKKIIFEQADIIIVPNHYFKNFFASRISNIEHKIKIIPNGFSQNNQSISYEEKEKIKIDCSEGMDYFILESRNIPISKITTALKSFSIFKNWQKSDMKMVLFINQHQQKEIERLIENYKFKNAVIIKTNISFSDKMIGGAYAAILLNDLPAVTDFVEKCIDWKTPFILPKADYLEALFENTPLYYDLNEKDLSKQLINIYKDEGIRNEQLVNIKNWADSRQWDKIAEKVSNLIFDSSKG
jgi:hypothetical protein